MYTQISGQMKRYTYYLAFMEYTSGTIFPPKKSTNVSYACYKKISKDYTKNYTIPYRLLY